MKDKILKRHDLVNKIIDEKSFDNVKLLKGITGSGKSVLLKQIIGELKNRGVKEDNIFHFSLMSWEYRQKDFRECLDIIESKIDRCDGKAYLFFDDVEYYKKWQSILYYLSQNDCEIYAAINYSKFFTLNGDFKLCGRSRIIEVFPFSFKEYLEYFQEFGDEKKSTEDFFTDYVRNGGLPDLIHNNFYVSNNESLKYFLNCIVAQNFFKKDEGNFYKAHSFLEFMIERFGEIFSKKDLDKCEYCTLNSDELSQYLTILNRSFMHKSEIAYDYHRFRFDERYYLIDHAFYQLIYQNPRFIFEKIIKNIIYVELLRRGYRVNYLKFKNKNIDFIAFNYDRNLAIQFTHLFLNEDIALREIDDLNLVHENYEKYIITAGEYDFSKYGVKHLNIIDFLLGTEI